MPFIKQEEKIQIEELRVKIQTPVTDELKKYAEFLKSSQSHVVQEVLRKAMKMDKDFQKHLNPTGMTRKRKGKNALTAVA